jgi:hypothetical protein
VVLVVELWVADWKAIAMVAESRRAAVVHRIVIFVIFKVVLRF